MKKITGFLCIIMILMMVTVATAAVRRFDSVFAKTFLADSALPKNFSADYTYVDNSSVKNFSADYTTNEDFSTNSSYAAPASANPVISWGVNPNKQERTPEPPAGSTKMLAENCGIFVGNTESKKIYFTFDLGYEAGYTSEVLDILKENKIKAVFFLCGNYLKEDALIRRMLDEGHSIGNHTDRHKDLPVLSEEAATKDIVDLQQKYKASYPDAAAMKFFRPPQGRFNENVLRIAKNQGLTTTLWSIAIVDWGKSPIDATACCNKIVERLHPGAIILSHITNSGTPKMLRLLMSKIAEKDYQAGTPDELLAFG